DDESLTKNNFEFEIKCLLREIVSQDISSIVQSNLVVDTSNLQTKLDPYNDMQQNIKRLQAQLGDLKGKSKDTPCVSGTLNPLSQKLEDENVALETNPITVSQPHVITKKDVNYESNGFSSTRVDITAKTRRPQPSTNTKNDRVPYVSKSSCIKNKDVEVEEHPMNLLLSKNKKHMSSECNNIQLAIRMDKSEVVCAMCKQCLITANHDVYVLKYVNDINSGGDKHNDNVSKIAYQKKHQTKVKKPKKVESKERLVSPKPRKPRTCLRWSPTGRLFDLKGKLIESSDSECQSDSSKGDNACSSN
ncbi:hypothetical protein Tco_1527931, partial [Tanacetum coccineum]